MPAIAMLLTTAVTILQTIVSKTSCRRAAATVCPRPSPPHVGAKAPAAAEQTAT